MASVGSEAVTTEAVMALSKAQEWKLPEETIEEKRHVRRGTEAGTVLSKTQEWKPPEETIEQRSGLVYWSIFVHRVI